MTKPTVWNLADRVKALEDRIEGPWTRPIDDVRRRVAELERRQHIPRMEPQDPRILGFDIDTPVGRRLFRAYAKNGKESDAYDEYKAVLAEYKQMSSGVK